MSTTPAAASATANPGSHASARAQTAQGPGRAAQGQAGGDLFSNLLMLLSSTREGGEDALAPVTDLAGADASDARPDAPSQALSTENPLAALPGWPGMTPATLPAASGKGGAAAGATAGTEAAARLSADRALPSAATAAPEGTPTDAEAQQALLDAARDQPPQVTTTAAATPAAKPARHGTAWRPTVGGPGAASHPVAAAGAGPARDLPAHQLLQTSQSAGVRSTVALGERSAAVREAEAAGTLPGPAAGPNAGSGAPAAGGGGSGASTGGQDGQGPAAGWGPEPGGETEPFAARDAQDMPAWPTEAGGEDADAQAGNLWAAAPLRHASLRVGEDGQDRIDIQLNLSGQELRLDFRTDSADVRASLAESAAPSLGDLLQRSGIELADISVGAQTSGDGQPPSSRQPGTPATPAATGRGTRQPSASPDPVAAPSRPRSDGSRPLDLFA